jgi:hypothetical protein
MIILCFTARSVNREYTWERNIHVVNNKNNLSNTKSGILATMRAGDIFLCKEETGKAI